MDEYCCKARPYFSLLSIPFFPSHSTTYLNKQTIPSVIYFNIQFDYTIIFVPTDGKGSFGDNRRHALYNVSIEQMSQETTFVPLFSKCNVPKDAYRLVFEKILRCANDMVNEAHDDLSVLTIRVDLVVTTPDEEDSCDEGDYEDKENNGLDEEEMEVEEEIPARAIEGESYEVDYEDYYGYDGNDGFDEDEEEMEDEEEEEKDSELVPAITRAMKGESCEGDNKDEENNCLDEEDEDEEEVEVEVEEEDNELVPARAIDGDSYEVDYEDYYGYDGNNGFDEDEEEMEDEEEEEDNELVLAWASDGDSYEVDYGYEGNDGLEEDEEEMMVEEQNNWFIPAAKSCIEELETIKVEDGAQCVICFEDFNVGVRLPCSHMFHANCIHDWLLVGNSCPLCRFQLPTANASA